MALPVPTCFHEIRQGHLSVFDEPLCTTLLHQRGLRGNQEAFSEGDAGHLHGQLASHFSGEGYHRLAAAGALVAVLREPEMRPSN